jgi:integrase
MPKIDQLTAARVKSEKRPGDYLDGRGLYLQVRNVTSKSWLLKYSLFKRAREMGLGSAFDFSLTEARDMRDRYRKLAKTGIDPIEHRKAEQAGRATERAKAITFKQAAERFIAAQRSGWKNLKHAAQWTATLETYAYPLLGALPVQAIDTALVMKVLEPIWSSKPETAGRVRGRIESVISAAKTRGEYLGENPARWKGHLEHSLPKRSKVRKVENQPALAFAELPAFVQALRAREGIAAEALLFQILTAARPGNALSAQWSEIDLAAAVWTIADEDMKSGKEHKVPLSLAALAVLERMAKIRCGDFIFFGAQSKRPLSDAATGALIERMGKERAWLDPRDGRVIVPHGFRATFKTWAGDKTNFQREVIEKALAHQVGDETERAYDRGDLFEKRRKLMDAWAGYATSDPALSATVTDLSAHRAEVSA